VLICLRSHHFSPRGNSVDSSLDADLAGQDAHSSRLREVIDREVDLRGRCA
jgi:hypothetical protein